MFVRNAVVGCMVGRDVGREERHGDRSEVNQRMKVRLSSWSRNRCDLYHTYLPVPSTQPLWYDDLWNE